MKRWTPSIVISLIGLLAGCVANKIQPLSIETQLAEKSIDASEQKIERSYTEWKEYLSNGGQTTPMAMLINDKYKSALKAVAYGRSRVIMFENRNITREQMEFTINRVEAESLELYNLIGWSKPKPKNK